jgi:hypothetical protein
LVDDDRSRALLTALKSVVDGNNTLASAARSYGFKVEFLRGVPKEPYFYQGLVKIPISLADELEAKGEAKFPKRIPASDGISVWVRGKHLAILSDQLVKQLRKPHSIIRTPKDKIAAMFDLRVYKHVPIQQIGVQLGIPWQTVYDLIRNPDCKRIVGERTWEAAQPKQKSKD